MTPRDSLLDKLRASFADGTFVKVTLSDATAAAEDLRNVYVRLVKLKAGTHVSFAYRYARREITKNHSADEAIQEIASLLDGRFLRAHLFTTSGDWELQLKKGAGSLKARKATFTSAAPEEHDHTKPRLLTAGAGGFLSVLGVVNDKGEPRPGMADKLRQIQRFVEIFDHLFSDSALRDKPALRVVDMGAGKGYLTFAVFEFLRQKGRDVEGTGVELREDLVAKTNSVAEEVGFNRLRFVRGAIGEWQASSGIDVLLALHACNTATDDAIYQGIQAGASLIILSPCCHQELRPQLVAPGVLRPIFNHGILVEREAEIVTDALRALLLEIHGYKASVFEFIAPEHTGKNLMIAAQKRTHPIDTAPLRERLQQMMEFYGIHTQRLAVLLGELPETAMGRSGKLSVAPER